MVEVKVSRKKTEIDPVRAERIKKICELEHISQSKLARLINMTQQNLSRIMTLRNGVTDLTINRIHEIYPKYRKAWIRGDDDFMTDADLFMNSIHVMNKEGELLRTALLAFVQLSDYQIEFNPIYGNGDIEKTLQNMKNHCTISKEGKSITFSLAELNAFENELFDYFEFRLSHMMK